MRTLIAAVLLAAPLWAGGEPRLAPLLGTPPEPASNPSTPEKVRLGELLFNETMLSGAGRRSCATCHKKELLFMDGLTRAWGLHDMDLDRKTPGLLNVGWQKTLFFDGRAKTLEEQAAFPLRHPREMDLDPSEAAARLRRDPGYRRLFEKVFPGEPLTFDLVAKAIAAYERTLVSRDSDLDRYLLGDEDALTPAARRGMELFTGKARCIECHHGPLLTGHEFHYTGVPEREGDNPPGTKYKTQSLRDAARRYSFMHNGVFLKLEDVIDHYARGGSAPEGVESEISPIRLSEQEKKDLMAFLASLNGRIVGETAAEPAPAIQKPKRKISEDGPVQDPSYAGSAVDPSYADR